MGFGAWKDFPGGRGGPGRSEQRKPPAERRGGHGKEVSLGWVRRLVPAAQEGPALTSHPCAQVTDRCTEGWPRLWRQMDWVGLTSGSVTASF